MRLQNLKIDNFRSFENYKLDDLARVNLIVGENNSGKTSVLEAGYLLTSSNPLQAIEKITQNRGETSRLDLRLTNQPPTIEPTVDCLFFSRSISPESRFRIMGRAEHSGDQSNAEFDALIRNWESLTDPQHPNVLSPVSCRLEMNWKFDEYETSRKIWMTGDGALLTHAWAGNDVFEPASKPSKQVELSSEFISLIPCDAIELARHWDKVLRSGNKSVVVECLSVLHGNINDVLFLPGVIGVSQRLDGVLLQLVDEIKRVPLTSIGDGSQRLLVMATAVSSSLDGTLFIDEIDTGLHYSKLPDMWRMMITAAVKNNVQIMATTHSLDCIRALATACDDDESIRQEVALFSIDRRMDEAVRYGGEELSVVVDHEIEVR